MEFASEFDAALAAGGPAAVFVPDREGKLRFDAEWTRDAWERQVPPLVWGHRWVLVRDRDSGFVNLLLVTSPGLLVSHPRGDVRVYADLDAALVARRPFLLGAETLAAAAVASDPW